MEKQKKKSMLFNKNHFSGCLAILTVMYISLFSCKKEGRVIITYSGQQVLPAKGLYSQVECSNNTVVVRFCSGFSSDIFELCFKEFCDIRKYVTTDNSTAFATTIIIPLEENSTGDFELKLRGEKYFFPLLKNYQYIDISIGDNNVLNVNYSNDILILS